jgi:hypothetical protein
MLVMVFIAARIAAGFFMAIVFVGALFLAAWFIVPGLLDVIVM